MTSNQRAGNINRSESLAVPILKCSLYVYFGMETSILPVMDTMLCRPSTASSLMEGLVIMILYKWSWTIAWTVCSSATSFCTPDKSREWHRWLFCQVFVDNVQLDQTLFSGRDKQLCGQVVYIYSGPTIA